MKFLIFAAVLFFQTAEAEIINKIIANVENNSLTLIEAKREKNTYLNKRTISPQIYTEKNPTLKLIVDLFIKKSIIRIKLKEIGYEIDEKQVEAQIKNTESRLGLSRNDLLEFLKSNGLTFKEYFDTTRESIEYNIFLGKVIKPLVKITDQEILNKYRSTSKNDSLTYKYDLVDFFIHTKLIKGIPNKIVKKDLNTFRKTGILPPYIEKIENNLIKDVSEENLSKLIKSAIKLTKKESFSNQVVIGELTHYFFVKEKTLIESENFRKQKPIINQIIFEEKSKLIIDSWINQKRNNYFISTNI